MRDDNSINPVDKQIKDGIKNIIEKREGTYKSVLVTTALSKAQDSWKNVFTKFTLSNIDEVVSEKFEYDNFILNKVSITVDEFFNMLDDLILKGDLNIKNCPDVKVTGTFEYDTYWRYRSSNDEAFKNDWPMHNYIFRLDDKARGHPSSDPLVSPQNPHFPNTQKAIKYYFGFDLENYSSSIFISIPNYQLKIDKLTIGSNHLNMELTVNGVRQGELVGKLYYEKGEHIKTEDFRIDKNPMSIHIDFIPDMISVYLLRNDGEILYFGRIHLNWPSSPSKDVVIDIKESDILNMLKQGENQYVEFKRELNNKDKEEFAETVVAFANGKGGTILIDVDDKSNIVGCNQDKIEDAIVSSLKSRCDPFIAPDIKKVTTDDGSIIVIRIYEGTNKPYTLRDKGIYVRSGSTDRIASRIELDEFYDQKKKYGIDSVRSYL